MTAVIKAEGRASLFDGLKEYYGVEFVINREDILAHQEHLHDLISLKMEAACRALQRAIENDMRGAA